MLHDTRKIDHRRHDDDEGHAQTNENVVEPFCSLTVVAKTKAAPDHHFDFSTMIGRRERRRWRSLVRCRARACARKNTRTNWVLTAVHNLQAIALYHTLPLFLPR